MQFIEYNTQERRMNEQNKNYAKTEKNALVLWRAESSMRGWIKLLHLCLNKTNFTLGVLNSKLYTHIATPS